jgi:glutathione S-transferase
MTMKFYMTPGSCSTGIHILLEEIGLVFEAHLVNLLAGDQHQPAYLAINPKATIPALMRDDGTVLCEFQSIAWWLARTYPKNQLLPATAEGEARVLEVMGYVTATVHGQGFARLFTTDKFSANPAEQEAVRTRGREIVDAGFAVIETLLAQEDFVAADHFTIADAALFYVEFWADRTQVPLPPNCRAHYQRLLTRPAVRQVLMEEGYAKVLAQ